MKRFIILVVGFLTIGLCARAQEGQSGQLYFEPSLGLTITSCCGFNTGLAFGYHWDCGVNLSLSGNYQRMYCSNLWKMSADVDYEFLHFEHSYPYISAGVGFISDVPFSSYTVTQPLLNYRIGYNIVLMERVCDLGINYGGECIFLLGGPHGNFYGAILGHSVNLSVRMYITGHDL